MYYQVFRGDGSSKNYKILSEMLEDFDRLDVEELYRLVKERYSASRPEGFDLMLWGDLHTLFEPDEDDEIWKDQHEYKNGLAIHMLTEKKYPLSQEMISKMLKKKLEVDHESSQAIELLRTEPVEPLEWKALENRLKLSNVKPPKLELKELPEHLEYAFLQENNQLLVVISSVLSTIEKTRLLEVLKNHKGAIAWSITDIKGIESSFCTHKILMEDEFKPSVQPQRRVNPKIKEVVKKEVIKLLDVGLIYPISDSPWVSPVQVVPKKRGITIVNNKKDELISQRTITGSCVCIDYRKLNNATRKDHFPLLFIDQMLERLARHEYYCFLDGFSGYFQIPIAPEDQEKTTFTCPYRTFAYKRMPFGLCNAPTTFQHCMTAIFHELIKDSMEVFMDDFSVFGNSFDHCLKNLEKMLKRCEETNLVLNWEKCHFMVKEGIILGHKVSSSGIEADNAKIKAISKLPHPTNVKAIRSFLGHAGFYRRFIKDFSQIAHPITQLLVKDDPFNFPKECIKAFDNDYAVRAVLRQRIDKHFKPIHYASKTMNEAQENYAITKKELLAIIFAYNKFHQYLVLSKTIILLLKEFDIEIRDKKGAKNLADDHFSRLENPDLGKLTKAEIRDLFPEERLMDISDKNNEPWYADYANYLASRVLPFRSTRKEKQKFFSDLRHYFWDEPFLFK
ncbi:putative nucleotidyltransferase, ribonuclease H [Tanacetum coccineum]|uniref:Nucleotidyltransferase, ribonuclease H n=1 Tax=Tanacetum coccineum TaxID=301880 RepID=A0ABQ5GHM7_9ASTR